MNKIEKAYYLFRLIPQLGLANMVYVFYYRFSLKFGLRKRIFPIQQSIEGPFFYDTEAKSSPIKEWDNRSIERADKLFNGRLTYFSYHQLELKESDSLAYIPNWFYNPFDNKIHTQSKNHWTEINDFGEGDIKIIWELSRFDWVITLAKASKVSNHPKYHLLLNLWLNDWCKYNPTNVGPNWKCGQETSFRIMKILTAAKILDQLNQPLAALKKLIYHHVNRIEANINYAIAQENNHSTSEAIGLYIGSLFLIKNGDTNPKLVKFKNRGRDLLEKMIEKLILDQGTFSQLSTNYHRVFLDTLSFCLDMMNYFMETPFNVHLKNKLEKSGEWLYKMIMGQNGDAPNFGSNDGAMIENLHSCDYRDFRPSTQLFFALLKKVRIYDKVDVSEAMYWRCGEDSLNYPLFEIKSPAAEILDRQIFIAKLGKASLFIKIPDKKFRQGNDALHIDLWHKGINILCDSGTFSYNAGEESEYFKSVKSHNTIQFGDIEQMPKISRFLNAEWPKAKDISLHQDSKGIIFQASYFDFRNNTHTRKVELSNQHLRVEDTVKNRQHVYSRFHVNKAINTMLYLNGKIHENSKEVKASKYYNESHDVWLIVDSRVPNFDSKNFETKFTLEINLAH